MKNHAKNTAIDFLIGPISITRVVRYMNQFQPFLIFRRVKGEKVGGLWQVLNKPKSMSKITQDADLLFPVSVEYNVFSIA